jgi:hypothetical protein
VRVRDDIAQRVRDDMIDFDALPPWAREKLSRYLFILPFVYGAGKWPAMFLREYPARAAVMALVAAQHAREQTPGRATSVLESGRTEIGGREVDLGWLSPFAPAAGTAEDLVKSAQGLDPRDGSIELRPLAGMLSPQYRSLIDTAGYGGEPVEQIGRSLVPGYSTVERVREGGGVGEQALRFLGSDIRYIEPTRNPSELAARRNAEEQKEVLAGLKAESPQLLEGTTLRRRITKAYERKTAVDAMRARVKLDVGTGEPYDRAVLLEELKLLRSWDMVGENATAKIRRAAKSGTWDEVKAWRAALRSDGFAPVYLELIYEAKQEAGVR